MDLRQIPTTADIAKMLDSIGTCLGGACPETLHVGTAETALDSLEEMARLLRSALASRSPAPNVSSEDLIVSADGDAKSE